MEFRRYLTSNGVSPASAEEALTGQPVTTVRDQSIIRRLGYHVGPHGEVSLARSLGPESSLPAAWLALERARTTRPTYLDQALAQQPTVNNVRIGVAETVGSWALPAVSGTGKTLGTNSLIGVMARVQLNDAGLSAADDRKARIAKLELQIAALKAEIENVKKKLEAELQRESLIWHLANPFTFPFFLVVYNAWKESVRALQRKMMELIAKLTELYAELARLKSS
jgi:hypothetical protein